MTGQEASHGSVLAVSDLDVSYGAAKALSGVSFELAAGAAVALLGPNGAGKTSLARACSGLARGLRGRVTLDGTDITRWNAARIRRAGLVYLPEGHTVFPDLTVRENLRLAVALLPGRDRAASLDAAMEMFPVLARRPRQSAGTLSGGEQQMLSLARAVAGKPKVVVIDEPSLGLAPLIVDAVYESLGKIRELGVGMILIEQFIDRCLALCDTVVILQKGTIRWQGPGQDARSAAIASYLGQASPEAGHGADGEDR